MSVVYLTHRVNVGGTAHGNIRATPLQGIFWGQPGRLNLRAIGSHIEDTLDSHWVS